MGNRKVGDRKVDIYRSVGESVWDSVMDYVGISVSGSVWNSVWDSVGSSVRSSVWDSIWDSVGSSVNESTQRKIDEK